MMAMKRMSTLASGSARVSPEARQLGENIAQYKEESEKENVDEVSQQFFYRQGYRKLMTFPGPQCHAVWLRKFFQRHTPDFASPTFGSLRVCCCADVHKEARRVTRFCRANKQLVRWFPTKRCDLGLPLK